MYDLPMLREGNMRYQTIVTATWASGSPTSNALPVGFDNHKGATVCISGAWTDCAIGLQIDVVGGLFMPLMDWQAGWTGVSIASASGNAVHQAPPSWYYAGGTDGKVRLWSHDGTGANVQQADTRTVLVMLKG